MTEAQATALEQSVAAAVVIQLSGRAEQHAGDGQTGACHKYDLGAGPEYRSARILVNARRLQKLRDGQVTVHRHQAEPERQEHGSEENVDASQDVILGREGKYANVDVHCRGLGGTYAPAEVEHPRANERDERTERTEDREDVLARNPGGRSCGLAHGSSVGVGWPVGSGVGWVGGTTGGSATSVMRVP